MCGIAGVYLKDPNAVENDNDRIQFDRFIDALFLGIEPRGHDAAGFIAAKGSTITLDKDNKTASAFIKTRKRAWLKDGTRQVLLHTRLFTQGHPSDHQNNHPVMYGTTFVTHNGHIGNDDDVFDELDLPRHDIAVDSVAISAALHKHGFANLKEALKPLIGSYAFAAVNPKDNPDELLIVKGPTSPVAYFENKYMLVWASTGTTIKEALSTILGSEFNPKLEYLSEGDVIFVRDGDVGVEKKFFEPTRKTYYTSYTGGWKGYGTPTRPTTTNVVDTKSQIWLMDKEGKAKAIIWERRDTMTDDQKRLYNGRWSTCLHCGRMVAEFHLIRHTNHGMMCIDCFAIVTSTAPKSSSVTGKGAEWAQMDEHDYQMLVETAEFDVQTVKEAVELASMRTGMPEELIQWLVFYSDFNNLDDVTEQLRERAYEVWLDCEDHVMRGFLPPKPEADACTIPPERQIEPPKPELPQVLGKCDHCRRKAKVYKEGLRFCTQHYTKCRTSKCKSVPVGHNNEGAWCHEHSRGKKGLRYIDKVPA